MLITLNQQKSVDPEEVAALDREEGETVIILNSGKTINVRISKAEVERMLNGSTNGNGKAPAKRAARKAPVAKVPARKTVAKRR